MLSAMEKENTEASLKALALITTPGERPYQQQQLVQIVQLFRHNGLFQIIPNILLKKQTN